MAAEMEQPVDDVAGKFALPGGAKLASLLHCIVDADEEFTVKAGFEFRVSSSGVVHSEVGTWNSKLRTGVIKGDHIRRPFMLEEVPVHPRHFLRADEMDGEFERANVQLTFERVQGKTPQQPGINRARPLVTSSKDAP